jgi:hypothetical protein
MKFNNLYRNTIVAGSVVISTAVITGCSSDDDPIVPAGTSSVRIIHASADAPPVDIKLNDAVAVPALDYPDSTGFVSITAGTYDVAVDAIVPGGNLGGVITVNDIPFEKDQRYTVVALDDTANISEFVAAESAATPGSDEVAISVLHAATAVKGIDVDVYVTGFNADISSTAPNFSFDFKGQADAGALAAGEYQIRIVAGGDTANPAYDSGKVDLTGFGGQKLLLVAVNTVNSTTKAASPVKLMAYTDTAQVELIDTRTTTGARVVHLSPDAAIAASGPVEVFASSSALPSSPAELIPSFSYTETEPGTSSYVGVPAGDYIFDVAPDGAGIGNSVYKSPAISLATAAEYTVIAAGYVLTSPAFDLLPTMDSNRSIVTQASVKVVHGAPLAGTVDVFVTPAGQYEVMDNKVVDENGMAAVPLLDDFTFGTITDYVAVPPGDYDIRVVTEGGAGTVAIDVPAFNLAAGSVSTVIARQPISGGGTPNDFNLIVLSNQ